MARPGGRVTLSRADKTAARPNRTRRSRQSLRLPHGEVPDKIVAVKIVELITEDSANRA